MLSHDNIVQSNILRMVHCIQKANNVIFVLGMLYESFWFTT